MMYYRIGFTRVGGQGVKDGWQSVNIPPDIPPEITGRYTALQNANAAALGTAAAGEKITTELLTDNYSVYLSKINYGLADDQGRPSMFADSFICDLKAFTENPKEVLRLLKSDNFSFAADGGVRPPQLLPEFDINAVEETLGLGADKRALLMKCVYAVMTSRAKETLHIICDCSDATIANVMFYIYSSLFLPFRKSLTFATYAAMPKTVIFSRTNAALEVSTNLETSETSANSAAYKELEQGISRYKYFDLSSGETNIPESTVKKFTALGVIDEIAETPAMVNLNYFKSFENDLRAYGCAETTSLNLYKLVWEAEQVDSIANGSDSGILRKLNELLSADVPNRNLLDEQILKLFMKVVERRIPLNEIMLGKLARMPSVSENATLNNLCAVCVYGKICSSAPDGGGFDLPDFADGSELLTFEEVEQLPVEIPDELFSDEELDEYADGEESPNDRNPLKRFMKKFSKK